MPSSHTLDSASASRINHPPWAASAVIYQINTRQFTPEGTFRAAETHLGRLQELGVELIYLMPIHPIGKLNRKGSLGSPYAVQDYFKVNPEFGTMEDLRSFVEAAQQRGMHVILDWVANHTAWDNPLTREHPDWYARDWKGDFQPTPWLDWEDVIDLDYRSPDLRRYMAQALKYWVKEIGIDGYRCDVAGFVPLDFWVRIRKELEEVKSVFLLAEWESRDLHQEAFDASYAWTWYEAVLQAAAGGGLAALRAFYAAAEKAYPDDALRMTFVSNHDKNAWEGTQFEQFGPALESSIALSVVGSGIPLIYNGQEAGNPRRLAFFERDPIQWNHHPIGDLYRSLITLKKRRRALWNGHWGGPMIPVLNTQPEKVFSFTRWHKDGGILALFNFSDQAAAPRLTAIPHPGPYQDFSTGSKITLRDTQLIDLPPWGYRVLEAC